MSLEQVQEFFISREVVAATEASLRTAGRRGHESFALWTGTYSDPGVLTVEHLFVPRQTAHRSEDGVCVTVSRDELDRLNRWLYAERQVLAVQLHTHPGLAYHSDTDNAYPIVTTLGGLSIVLANFGRSSFESERTATYRLGMDGWERLDQQVAHQLIRVR